MRSSKALWGAGALAAVMLVLMAPGSPLGVTNWNGGIVNNPIEAPSATFTNDVQAATGHFGELDAGNTQVQGHVTVTGPVGVGGTATFGDTVNASEVDAGTLICQGDTTLKGTASTGGMVTVGTNAVNQLELSGSAGAPTVSVNGPGADIGLSLQAKGTGAVRVDSPYPFAVDSPATFGDTVNASEVDAGTLVVPTNGKMCFSGVGCTANFAFDGAALVCSAAAQFPNLNVTGTLQPLGSVANSLTSGSCTDAAAVCVADSLNVGNSGTTRFSVEGATGNVVSAGEVSATVVDAGVAVVAPILRRYGDTTGSPTCTGGLTDPRRGQHVTQPASATQQAFYTCDGTFWRADHPSHTIAFQAQTGTLVDAQLVNRIHINRLIGTPSLGGRLLYTNWVCVTNGTAGGGDGGFDLRYEWKDGDGGTPKVLCNFHGPCTCSPGDPVPSGMEPYSCPTDTTAHFGSTGVVEAHVYTDCTAVPSFNGTITYEVGQGALPL